MLPDVMDASPEAVFSARLRDAREAAGMTQAELAALVSERHGIQLDPMTVLRMEKGRRRITLNEAVAVADVLGIRLFDLLLPVTAMMASAHPDRRRKDAERLAGELEKLDGQLAQTEADTARSRAKAGELRRRRNEVQVELAALTMAPGFQAVGVDEITRRFRDEGGQQ